MARINRNYEKLPGSYLFSEIARRTAAYQEANPDARLIKMGIGDVTRPLAPTVVAAMHAAVDDLAAAETFHGYGPEQGYAFLRDAIAEHDFAARNIAITSDEIFISDGAKSDCGNIGDIFAEDNVVAVCDPVYPVYVDSNAMAGRAGDYVGDRWSRLVYLPCNAENGFVPPLPDKPVDVVYLCYPNNPTGTVLTKAQLKVFVDWAKENGAIIIYDAAYRAYVTNPEIPLSIYEVEGARDVAIECNSFSKTAGFTGTRCAYTVVPHEVCGLGAKGEKVSLNDMWKRRMATKFNGVSYPVQRGAAAVYTPQGQAQIKEVIDSYMENARLIRESLQAKGFDVYGGTDAPYIWLKTPGNMDSWTFFDKLLAECNIVGTPGAGFGPSGEGYFRLTAFNTREKTLQAMERVKQWQI